MIALKAVVADMISYAALFVLAKLLVSQFISGEMCIRDRERPADRAREARTECAGNRP